MKLIASLCLALPVLLSQEKLHVDAFGPDGDRVRLSADRIEREAPTLEWQASVIHLKGDVVIRIPFLRMRATGEREKEPERLYMIMQADEADYYEDSGRIEPRGRVRVNFDKPK